MKRIILGTAIAIISLSAQSQDYLFENPDNKAFFGARLGVDITSTPGDELSTYSNGAGFSLGAIYNIPVYKNLYVEPGLSLFYDTFSEDLTVGAEVLPMPYQISRSFRNFGFRIPILAGYHFDFSDMVRIAPFTGPQLNFSLYAHDHYDNDAIKNVLGEGNEMKGTSLFGEHGFKHFDLQWVFGASVTYDRYVFTAQGAIGITKVYNVSSFHFRRNTCTISVGYNF